MFEISCLDLGVSGCDYVARGEVAGDVVSEMITHLREEHDLDMPSAEKVLKDYHEEERSFVVAPGSEMIDPDLPMDGGVRLVVTRLMEQLERSE